MLIKTLGPTSMNDCILIWFRANLCKGWTDFLWLRFLDFELLSTYLKGVWRFEKEEGAVDKSVVHSVMCWMPLFIRGRGGAPPSLPLSKAVRAHLPSAHCHSGFYCVRTLSLCLSHWIQYQQSASVCVCVSVSLSTTFTHSVLCVVCLSVFWITASPPIILRRPTLPALYWISG